MEMLSAVATEAAEPQAWIAGSKRSDEALARQSARGSTQAFEALYDRYHQPLYQYCRSILRHEADAQDALQSTFAKALPALQNGQRNAPLRPWLFRIAHNESISIIRARRRDEPSESVEQFSRSVASAEEELAAREELTTLMRDLAELPEKQRGALLQRELNGLSHEEIAISRGTSAGAAKQLIFEARQGLAESAEGREMECAEVRRRISDADRRVLRSRRVRAHMRDCARCTAFAAAIPARSAELRALAPVLAPAAAAELFGRALHSAGGHATSAGATATATGAGAGTGTGAGTGAAAAGAAGKFAGGGLIWKAVAGGVILAGAAVGVAKLHHVHHRPAPALHRATSPGGASSRSLAGGAARGHRGHSRANSAIGRVQAQRRPGRAAIGLPAVHRSRRVAGAAGAVVGATPLPVSRRQGSPGKSSVGHSHGQSVSTTHKHGRSSHSHSGSSRGTGHGNSRHTKTRSGTTNSRSSKQHGASSKGSGKAHRPAGSSGSGNGKANGTSKASGK